MRAEDDDLYCLSATRDCSSAAAAFDFCQFDCAVASPEQLAAYDYFI